MVKNMKKVICGILCMMMVFSMFTVSAATLTIDEENIVVSDADATGLRTVTIPYTVTVASDEEAPAYLTMLASKTETVDATNIGTSAIGIEQIANDAAVTSISFVTDKIEAGATYYVKMGATNLATPATATFSLAAAGGDPVPATYTVTFYAEADAATAYATKTTDADGKVEAPTAPTKAGFTFAGWATTAGATAADVDLATKVFDANTTLYAVWTAVPASTVKYGDITGDGRVNIRDAQRIGQWLVKKINLDGTTPYVAGTPSDDQIAAGDLTKDGKINIRDAQRIGQWLVKKVNLDGTTPYDPNKTY